MSKAHRFIWALGLSLFAPLSQAAKVYIPLGEANEIAVVDTEENRVVNTIKGVEAAHGLALSPDGALLVAASVASVPAAHAGPPSKPTGMSEDEHAAHHSRAAAGRGAERVSYLTLIRAENGKILRRLEVPGAVHHVAITPDGRYAVATLMAAGSASIVDLQSQQVTATIPTGPNPNYAVAARNGRTVYVSNSGNGTVSELDVIDGYVRRNLRVGEGPEHMVLSRDGAHLYVNNTGGGTVSVLTMPEGRVTETLPTGRTPHGIDLSADGRTLFVALTGEDRVLSVNLDSHARKSLPLGPAPYHLARVPGGHTLYVSSRTEPRVWVLNGDQLAVQGEFATRGIAHQSALPPEKPQ